ncbi:MAG: TRAP transporter small permease [Pseudomonadota bacterium]
MIQQIENGVNRLVRYMYYIAGFALVVMMAVTVTDVFMRFCVTLYATFRWPFLESWKPIPGTYDLVSMSGSVAAAFAMAHTTVKSGHVSVSLVVSKFGRKTQVVIKMITDTLSGLLFGVIALRCIVYARDLKESGEVSMTLQLPFHPFVYLLSFSAFAVTIVFVLNLIKDFQKVMGK